MIADFFIHLHEVRKFSLPAIRGYRSALAHLLRHRGVDLTASEELKLLLRNFALSVPPRQLRPPPWDVNVVLTFLRSSTFEPQEEVSTRLLLIKTLFLVALATAQRVGELQALSASVGHAHDWSSVTLEYDPLFVAKTETPSNPVKRVFKFSALGDFVGLDPEEMLLCPVRSLRAYLARVSPSRPSVRRLFVSLSNPSRPMSKGAISYYLRQAIILAYETIDEDIQASTRVKAHEIRAVSSSLLFRRSMSMRTLFEAAIWRTGTTFASFYLRDVAHHYLDVSGLGPVVAAMSVV